MNPDGPVYERIEFCSKPEKLWGKVRSGRYEWLGVHPDGTFIVGSPPARKRRPSFTGAEIRRAGTTDEKAHRIGIEVLHSKGPSYDSYPTAEAAASAFDDELRKASDPERQPGMARLPLWDGSTLIREEFVVRRPPTYR